MIAIQLDLFEDVVALPWYGRDPRSLTRAALALFLRRKPQKACAIWIDPAQLELPLEVIKKAPWIYQGAPTLFGD